MKQFVSLATVLCWFLTSALAQSNSYLEFGTSPSNISDALVHSRLRTTNYGTHDSFQAVQNTNGGQQQTLRGLVRFDDFPGTLPSGAIVDSAKLEYYVEMPTWWTHSTNNASFVQRVSSGWDESTVVWDNQPSVDTAGQLLTPIYPVNYTGWDHADVTEHVQHFLDNPGSYHGWRFQLQQEAIYRMLYIRSSDFSSGIRAPKLKVWYHLPPLPGMYFSTTNTTGLIFNSDRSGVAMDADFTSDHAYLQSEQRSAASSGEVEFTVGAGFVGTIGLDIEARIDREKYSIYFQYDGEKYYLYNGTTEVASGSMNAGAEYKFQRTSNIVEAFLGGVSIYSGRVTEQQEWIQVIGQSEGTVHLPYFRSDFTWSDDPFGTVAYSDLNGGGGGKITVNKADGYYYLWNVTPNELLSCSQLTTLNTNRTNTANEDPDMDLSAFGGTQSCTQYFDSLGNDTIYFTDGTFPTVLTAYNPSTETQYTRIFELPDEVTIAYGGDAMNIGDTRWTRTDTVTNYDTNGLVVPTNGTEGEAYSSLRFRIGAFGSSYAVGILKPEWDAGEALLPTHGLQVEENQAHIIFEGSVQTQAISLTKGDHFQVGKMGGEFHVIQNGVSIFQETIGTEDYAFGAVLKGGGIDEPILIGSSNDPTVTIASPSTYCSLDNTENFIYNAVVDLTPVFDGLIKLPKNGSYVTQYQWKNEAGSVVSNTMNLTTAQPGIYTLETIVFTPFSTTVYTNQQVAIGYQVEWKQLNGTNVPQAHAIQANTPGNMGALNPYPITQVNAQSSNKIRKVNNLDFMAFSIPKISYDASVQAGIAYWGPRDVLSLVDDAGNPVLSVIIAYDVQSGGPINFPYPFYIKALKPRYASIRYHVGPASWVDLSPYTSGTGDLSFVFTYDYTTDDAKLYAGGQLLLTAPVHSSAVIGGSAVQPQNLKVYYSYIHSQSFTSPGFDFAPEGMRDIICSRACESIPYYEMWPQPNGNTVLSYQKMLGIRFYEDYTPLNQALTFTLYNNQGVAQSIPSGVTLAKAFGENRILIRLTDLNIVQGESYLLEAANEKGEKRYIRFTY